MSLRLRVLGASGVAGRAFVPLAEAAGHRVLGDRVDVLDAGALRHALRGVDAVVNLASAIPRPGGPVDWSINDRIRREGTANVLAACRDAGVPRLVQQGVAMLHAAADARPQHEDDPLVGQGVLASALDMERLLHGASPDAGLDVRIVRGGLFYGGGSGTEARLVAALREGGFRLPGSGQAWVSPVHVEDYARAVLQVLELPAHALPGRAFIACDDGPLRWHEVYARAAAAGALPVPPAWPTGAPLPLPSFRTTNARLRATGWRPRHALFGGGHGAHGA